MAASKDKSTTTTGDQPATTIEDAEANAERAEGGRTSLPEGTKVVSVAEGPEYGYIGSVPDETPDEDYTVTGVAGATAKATDKPKSAGRSSS